MSATQIAKVVLGGILGSGLTYGITNRWFNGPKMPYVRALNYHDTPAQFAANFRKQLAWYARHFSDCNQQQLRTLLDDGTWSNTKPGLIISFDDGLKSNYEIAAPLLEEFGFTGWFMIPVSFLDAGTEAHTDFAATNNIAYNAHLQRGNLAMSWDDVRDLEKRGHVITCHSMNHKRLSDSLTDDELQEEIERSKAALESRLGHAVSGFTWVGGEESSYSRRAFQSILRANYTEVFCTNCEPIVARQNPLFLERSNIEANFGLNQVRLVLGGMYDRKYAAKRQRVFNLLTT